MKDKSVSGHGNVPMPKKGKGGESVATVGMHKVKTGTVPAHKGGAGSWNGYKG